MMLTRIDFGWYWWVHGATALVIFTFGVAFGWFVLRGGE
jgi:hypothetical protein